MSLIEVVLVRGTIVVLLSWLANIGLRRTAASWKHWVWGLGFGGLLLTFALPMLVPAWELDVLPAAEARDEGASLTPVETSHANAAPTDVVRPAPRRWSLTSFVVWARWVFWFGVILGLLKVAHDLTGLRRIRSSARSPTPRMRATVAAVQRRHALHGEVYLASSVRVPIACGWWRPMVVLPEQSESWESSRLELVLLHELLHIQRRDPVTTLLAQLIATLYWPNPFVALALRQLTAERERACDEAVLAAGADRVGYANELLSWARALAGSSGTFATAMTEGPGLKQRVGNILGFRPGSVQLTRASAALSAALATAILVPFSIVLPSEKRTVEPDDTLGALLTTISSGTRAERNRALWALGEKEDRRASTTLVQVLADPDPEARGLAAWALGEIKDRSTIGPLVAALADHDPYAREMAARALGEIGDRDAVPTLRAALADPHPGVRASAMWSLGEIRSRAVHGEALVLLDDPSPRVRLEAARQIARNRTPRTIAALVSLLDDHDAQVREEAALHLGRFGDERAVEPLIAHLRDVDPGVREAATWALDEINPSRRP